MEERLETRKNFESQPTSKNLSLLPSLWQVPPKLTPFTGRARQLNDLAEAVKHQQMHLLIRPTKQITGTGGIGKTQLAVEFAHRAYESLLFRTILWLNADCTVQEQLNIEFLQLATVLKIDTKTLTKQKLIQEVYRRVALHERVLIIFDSASSYQTILPYLPPPGTNISIVITTRDDQAWDQSFTQIPVDIFELEEAVDYIGKVIPDKVENERQAIALANTLGRFPLGLAQATGYIKTRNISIETYIGLYTEKRQNKQRLLDLGQLVNDPHAETIWTTVNLCVESVSSELARELLPSTAYLAPEVPIHKGLFRHLAKLDTQYLQAIDLLRAYSLVTNTSGGSYVRVHQLVQEVLQLSHNQQALRLILEHTAHQLEQFFIDEDLEPLAIETQRKELLPHLLNIMQHLKSHAQFTDESMQVVTGPLDYSIGFCFELLGQYDEAISYLTLALERYTIQNIPLRIANAASTLGTTLGRVGRHDQAFQLLQIAYDLKKEIYGENDIELAHIKVNRASNYRALGNYLKAKELLLESLEAFQGCLHKNHPYIANTMLTLANVYANLGDYEKQYEFAEKALEIYLSCYHAEHVNVASARSALAQACICTRKTGEAEQHLLFVIKIYEKEYGPDHPMTLRVKGNYGNYLINFSNQYQKAVEIYEYVLSIFEQTYDEDNLEVASCLLNLGLAYRQLNKNEGADKSLNRALLIYQAKLPYNDPSIFRTLQEIARSFGRKSAYKDELEKLKEVLRLKKSFYQGVHLELAETYKDLANCYFDLYQLKKAVKCASKAYEICVKFIGPKDAITLRMHDRLQEMQQFKTQYESSAPRQMHQVQPALMPNHNDEVLGKQCMQKGFYNSALAFFSRATVGVHNVSSLYDQIALCHLNLGDIDTARATLIDFPQSTVHQQIETASDERELLAAQLLSFDDTAQTMDAPTIIRKALLIMKFRDFRQAKALLLTVIEQHQDIKYRAPAYYQLALCHYHCQEFASARENLQKSAQLKAHENLPVLEEQINEAEKFYNQCRNTLI